MTAARYDVTVATILADDKWTFEATGRVLLFDGYRKLYLDADTAEDAGTGLPKLEENESLKLLSVDGEQNFTQPPPRFTEGTLVKELERQAIGRPSTYATILSTIQDKKYAERKKGKFSPTELGYVVTDLLRDNFPDIMDVTFTAQMEGELDRVEEGEVKRQDLLSTFWDKFKVALEAAQTGMKSVKREPEKTDLVCPRCDSPMVIRFGKNGAFLACSAFPKCKTTLAFERDESGAPQVIEEKVGDEKCTECGSPMLLKEGRFGKFWACSNYPTCKTTMPFSTGFTCPKEGCGGAVLEKKSKRKSTYYRCSNAPDCEFVSFGKLVAGACPKCSNPFLEEKGRGRNKALVCPKCGFSG